MGLLGGGVAGVSRAESMGTAFTYQGQLKENGRPTTGEYDFEFALYEEAEGGDPVVTAISVSDLAVTNGLFTVQPDFGVDVVTGDARYLEITFDDATLSPRQELTPTPHAIHADTAGSVPGGTTGSGTPNRIAMFTGTGASVADSVIYEAGGRIGIGAHPQSLLHLSCKPGLAR